MVRVTWPRVIAAYFALLVAVEVCRHYTGLTQALWMHEILVFVGLLCAVPVASLALESWKWDNV